MCNLSVLSGALTVFPAVPVIKFQSINFGEENCFPPLTDGQFSQFPLCSTLGLKAAAPSVLQSVMTECTLCLQLGLKQRRKTLEKNF